MVYKCFDKKTSRSGIENKKKLSKELVEELHKPIIRKFNERKVHSTFIGNIRGADLADMQLINWLIMDLALRYVLQIFIANMHGLLL